MSELLDLRKEDGSRKGETKERELVHRDGDLHGTSHVWLVRYRPTGDLPTCCFRSGAPIRILFRAVMTSPPRGISRQDRIFGNRRCGSFGKSWA